jgi:glycerol-3-phosphate acyltransferase PlsX
MQLKSMCDIVMKKIVIDTLGGDNGISVIVDGVIEALTDNKDLSVILVGDENVIKPKIIAAGLESRAEILHTVQNIPSDEHPTQAVKKYPDSSIVLGLTQLKEREDCGAFVSAGSTGAVLTCGFLKIGRTEGVSRPALCPNLPTRNGASTMLIDCGANADCKPENLVHFAIMANEYKKAAGVENPKIALLNVGAEKAKGNELTKQTFVLLNKLKEAGQINFVGNAESGDTLSGKYDVIVTDGFTGNILLKAMEGVTKLLFSQIKQVLSKGIRSKIAGLLAGGKIKKMKADYVDNVQAGSIFIGLKKPVIKMHGSAKARTAAMAVKYAATMTEMDTEDRIKAAIERAESVIT